MAPNIPLVVSNNFYDSNKDGTLDGAALCVSTTCYSNMDIVSTQFDYPKPAKLLTPQQALDLAIKQVGSSKSRDGVDKALITQVQSFGKEGALISDEASMGGVGTINGGTAPTDTDGDGIPDDFERANGLNPNDASDAMKIGASGYTNLEVYVNSLVPSTY
jgi:hypothetical protein